MKFHTLLADPPWPFEWRGGGTRKNGHGRTYRAPIKKALPYPTMTLDDICALPIEELAEPDAHLYLWIPDQHLIEGVGARVARAWGFEPGRLIVWRKPGYGMGRFPRPQHEALVVCRRGSLPFNCADEGSVQDCEWADNEGTVFDWPFTYEGGGRKHSAKPDACADLIERASPGPYLELFARKARFGWSYAGNESLGTVEVPGLDLARNE